MLKQTVSYTDFNDQDCTETLYFNLTKVELAENLHLIKPLEELQERFSGPARDVDSEDIRVIMDMVKHFMKLSYGVRSADGKRFAKSEELWTEFTQTAAYDEFLFSLFENPSRTVSFLVGIIPPELRAQAQQIASENGVEAETETPEVEVSSDTQAPAYVRENRAPRRDELAAMTEDEFKTAMAWQPQ